MDARRTRKRPWEEDSPIDVHPRSRDSTGERSGPPLPQHADHYPRDSQALSQRRLPPLYAPSYMAPAGPHASSLIQQLSPPVQKAVEVDTFKPRSQSLFDVFQPPKQHHGKSNSESITAFPGALDLNHSSPPIVTEPPLSRFGTDPTHGCCPSDCEGEACSTARTLMRRFASELILLSNSVRLVLETAGDYQLSNDPPEIEHVGTQESLQWAFDLVQWTNLKLQDQIEGAAPPSPGQGQLQLYALSAMRRGQHHLEQPEEQSPPARPFPRSQHSQHSQHSQQLQYPQHGYLGFAHPGAMNEDNKRSTYGNEMMPMASSPHHTASSSGSIFMPPQSPMQAPQSSRSGMLPSPSSMNFPNAPNLPPISSPSTTLHTSAQAVHLQDLQHQVSVKTLAFQTLQREYDSLLQKLERQRTKCATLEKKFEVSDVEINSLTDEKEKLQSQVSALESQVEDLQQSRDEARRQLVANGAQYMRIMEMANRLQAQGADDKKRWEAERRELEGRIKVLEEAMVTGKSGQDSGASPPPSITLSHNTNLSSTATSSTETINVLRGEIGRLRSRTQTLEAALQRMRDESISIQATARQLVESASKVENAAQGAMSG